MDRTETGTNEVLAGLFHFRTDQPCIVLRAFCNRQFSVIGHVIPVHISLVYSLWRTNIPEFRRSVCSHYNQRDMLQSRFCHCRRIVCRCCPGSTEQSHRLFILFAQSLTAAGGMSLIW